MTCLSEQLMAFLGYLQDVLTLEANDSISIDYIMGYEDCLFMI